MHSHVLPVRSDVRTIAVQPTGRTGRIVSRGIAGLLVAIGLIAALFVRSSDGTWYVREASLPQGWPELTPVDAVRVKAYPEHRAAVVRGIDVSDRSGRPNRAMFLELFRHIESRSIAMTAPVDMRYEVGERTRVAGMAFLYGEPTAGRLEVNGPVRVEDQPTRRYVSIGVRGDYTDDRFAIGLATLEAWLQANAGRWSADGEPRYLGYNGPLTPRALRYGEVQLPIRAAHEIVRTDESPAPGDGVRAAR